LRKVAFYGEEIIEEVKNANDIIDVIGSYVNLKKSGRNFTGLCPFHREKTPSFIASPDKQIFHCFGCGVGGSVISFISKVENLNFKESIEFLAERASIILPSRNSSQEESRKQFLRGRVFEINQLAAQIYHKNLYNSNSKIAQEYIKKRKLDNNTLKSFLIGYALNFDELYKFLVSKGFTQEEILASRLVNKNDNNKFIDSFRKRVMFPICDVRGKVIAFGGRVLNDSKPKYINSPDTIAYNKGRNLFGLNIAKEGNPKRIIVVEGYMDAISLHQRGIKNVVASLGTALTESQGRLLRKYAEEIVISYDSDAAGQAATLRGLDILNSLGCNVKVLQMEGAKDPDEYVIKYGNARFLKLVDNSISLVEFKVKVLKKEHNLEIDSEKIKFLTKIAGILAKVDNEIEKEIYIDNITKEYNIAKETLYAQINKMKYSNGVSEKILEKPKVVVKQINKQDENNDKRTKLEKLVLYLLIEYSEATMQRIQDKILESDFEIQIHRDIFKKVYEILKSSNNKALNIIDLFEEESYINYISGILSEDYKITDINKVLSDIENTFIKEKLTKRKNELIIKLDNKDLSKEERQKIEEEYKNIIIKLKK